jgi:hypothetical protein
VKDEAMVADEWIVSPYRLAVSMYFEYCWTYCSFWCSAEEGCLVASIGNTKANRR